MIIVKLNGGLGNQLFQYAVGRAVANQRNDELKLDISSFGQSSDRTYRLEHFCIRAPVATKADMSQLLAPYVRLLPSKLPYRARKLIPDQHRSIVRERHRNALDPEIFSVQQDNIHLIGYWQNVHYLSAIMTQIRSEFRVRAIPDAENSSQLRHIQSLTSVSLHIRRGDYVTSPTASQHHGVCSVEYYVGAAKRIAEQVPNPHFFVFSDDIDWSRDNLQLPFPMHFMSHNGSDKDYEDLRLMRNCQHHIIANSTFSWWGAWLCEYQHKIVIGPKKWFNSQDRIGDGLFPETWIRL